MKQWYITFILLTFLLFGCEPIQIVRELPPDEVQETVILPSPTPISSPTATAVVSPTPLPTLEPTITPTPTLASLYTGPAIELARFGTGILHDAALSPDGLTLAVATSIGIYLFDVTTWQNIKLIETNQGQWKVKFLPDGRLASVTNDYKIIIWNVADGSLSHTLTGHNKFIRDITSSVDGTTLASASSDGTIRLWQLTDQTMLLNQQPFEQGWAEAIIMATNGFNYVAGTDYRIGIWQTTDNTLQYLEGHTGRIYALALSPNNRWLASASQDGTVKVWDTETHTTIQTISPNSDITSIAFLPDNNTLLLGAQDGTLQQWQNGSLLQTISGHTDGIAKIIVTVDGLQAITVGADNIIHQWQLADGALQQSLTDFSQPMVTVDLSLDGQFVVGGDDQGWVYVWQRSDKTLVHQFKHSARLSTVRFSPDSSVIASAGFDGTVQLWRTSDGLALLTIPQTSGVSRFAFSPQGDQFVVGLDDGTAQIWRIVDQNQIYTFTGHNNNVTGLAFSPTDNIFASSSTDVYIWQLTDNMLLRTDPMSKPDTQIAFSIDGVYLAVTQEDTIHIKRAIDGTLTQLLQRHTTPIQAIDFAGVGYKLISGSQNATLSLWDVQTGQLLQVIEQHSGGITDVAFANNGTYTASASRDGTIRLWQVP